jgi:hypothetical protein
LEYSIIDECEVLVEATQLYFEILLNENFVGFKKLLEKDILFFIYKIIKTQ